MGLYKLEDLIICRILLDSTRVYYLAIYQEKKKSVALPNGFDALLVFWYDRFRNFWNIDTQSFSLLLNLNYYFRLCQNNIYIKLRDPKSKSIDTVVEDFNQNTNIYVYIDQGDSMVIYSSCH